MFYQSRKVLALICLASFLFTPASGMGRQVPKKGKIIGIVYDVKSGAPLPKARVEVVEQNVGAETGVDGDFSIELPPGTYTVKVTREGFVETTVDAVEVKAGEAVEVNAVLQAVGAGEQITVSADVSNDAASLLEDRKAAAVVSDSISAVEIARDTASDAAGVLQRVPGVTVQNDGFVFVRGLGDRYSNTVLNDSPLPTTEPDRRVVPMDLIPANLLQNMKVFKTFTPDQPGEFAGGLVKLETIDLPKAASLDVSFSMGFNSQTTGKDFLTYPGGGAKDFFGFGRNSRVLPGGIPENERLLPANPFLPGGFTPDQLQALGRSFENVWDPRTASARPDVGWGVSGGTTWGRLGFIAALNFKNELRSASELRKFYNVQGPRQIVPFIEYDYDASVEQARLGGALNLAYELSKDHKVYFKNFLTNQATDETRVFEGFNGDRGTDYLNSRLRYTQERISTHQLAGMHTLSLLGDSILNWRYTYSRATLDEPDVRETLYEFSPVAGDYIYLNQTQSLFRMFNEMRENVREPAFDWAKYWFLSNVTLNVKVGGSFINRDRLFDSRRFRFAPTGLAGIDTSQRPEQLLVPENIAPLRGFELREETRPTDHYDALQNIYAGYFMGDVTWRNWRVIGGARFEQNEQRVNTFEPFRVGVPTIGAQLDDRDWLPSLGIAYSTLNNNMAFRFGYSRTIARPQFRELSPFEFTDVTGGRSTVGNPDLRRTLITNWDLRWEWFLSPGELIAVSGFYKQMEDPIEVTIQATTQLRTFFRNVDEARNRGVEVEFRKNFGNWDSALRNLGFMMNYTYVKSDVQIAPEDEAILTSRERPLVGQAENVFNLALTYDIPVWNVETSVLYNYTGDRLTDVGAFGIPDLVQLGYPSLDFRAARRFGGERKWRLEFTAENLLNRQRDYRLDAETFRVYRTGRTYGVGISYTIF